MYIQTGSGSTPSGQGGPTDEIIICPNGISPRGYITLSSTYLYGPPAAQCYWTSDVSLKKDIATIPNALERVCNLRGVNYRMKDGQDPSLEMGVIAQEVEPVFPELVQTDKNGKKSVAYMALIGALVEALKSQQKEIADQQKELTGQEYRIEKLESEIKLLAKTGDGKTLH